VRRAVKKTTTTAARRRAAAAAAAKAKLPAAGPKASSPDMTLVAAGLALVVLVLAETAFLALSARIVMR
jgi:hypothetical protein